MNSQSHTLLSSKALQALEEKERERYITRRDADPSGRIFDKIEAATFEIADTFYQLIHTVQRREQVELEKYHDASAVQEESKIFDLLKSSIAERDALFDQLKKMHETPKNIPPPVTVTRPTPQDLKDAPEPVNYFTQPALHMVELLLKEERFQPIQSELTTIFDLMGLQASRHCEIKQEEEMKIITLELDLKDRERDLGETKNKLSATRKELGTIKEKLDALKEDTAKMTLYVEDLKEKIREQEGEKTVWGLEKNRTTDEIAEFKKQIETMSGSSAELEAARNKIEQLETMVCIMENAFAPKNEEIFLLKKSLVTKEKQVFQYKNSAAAKEETAKIISRELRGKEEHIADLRQELGKKEYEIRSLKSYRQMPSNVSSQNAHRGATANESTLLSRIEEAQRDYTQLKNTNQSLRDKNIGHEDAIKKFRRQLDLKELENKQLQTQVTRLTKQASDSLFRERR